MICRESSPFYLPALESPAGLHLATPESQDGVQVGNWDSDLEDLGSNP